MSDEITATKDELANDLLSVVRQNKVLVDKVNELQSRLSSERNKLFDSEKKREYERGRCNILRGQNSTLRNELKQAEKMVSKFKEIKAIHEDEKLCEIDRDIAVWEILEGMK